MVANSRAKINIGLDIKIARLRAGLFQYQLAARLGISPCQLSQIETDRIEPSAELLKRISQEIETAEVLMAGRKDKNPKPVKVVAKNDSPVS